MDPNELQVRLDVTIFQPMAGGNLRFSEEAVLSASGFMEVAKVLGQFHELFVSLKTAAE